MVNTLVSVFASPGSPKPILPTAYPILRLLWVILLLCTACLSRATVAAVPLAPGYSNLGYSMPLAGSYNLPPVALAADGEVVDSDGNTLSLHQLFGDRYVLLSFMYSSCGDVNGCPLTAHVFYQLKQAMAKDPVLAQNLRLVSLSFDPQHDTPEVMKLYANNFRHDGDSGQWLFATTDSEQQLGPILRDYGQDVQRQLAIDGAAGADFFHVLRVFLIDPQRQVRNIYSVSFLHTDLVLADLKTLLLEEEGTVERLAARSAATEAGLDGPGDRKDGYDSVGYRTRSLALSHRSGQAVDLISYAEEVPRGLPDLPVPDGVVLSRESIALGRKLFFDRRLSLNNTFSCAMCHVPEQGFTNNELATAVGIEGRTVRRNAPSLYNVGYATRLFHDGREDQLAQQVWSPLLAKNEMGNPSIGYVINKINALPDYRGLFESAYDGEGPGMQRIGDALTAYQLTLNAADSPFDRWYFGGDDGAVSTQVKQGFTLFTGKAACASCHLIDETHALFSDYGLHNTGVGYVSSQVNNARMQTVQLAPGVFVDVDSTLIAKVGEPLKADLGLYEITEDPADRWKFKTPSLRNVALTAPYMHDGSLLSLSEVIAFYNRGGIDNELLDPLLRPLGLTVEETRALEAFLQSLTGSNVPALVADAFAAPVGDTTVDSPQGALADVGSIELVDQHGRAFTLDSLRGSVVLLVFGFTNCPHICPVEMARVSAALRELEPLGKQVRGVFITVDPGRDTPEVIKRYISSFYPGITGLTGAMADIEAVTAHYRVKRVEQPIAGGDYLVDHGYSLYVLNREGEAEAAVLPGLPPSHIVTLVRQLMDK